MDNSPVKQKKKLNLNAKVFEIDDIQQQFNQQQKQDQLIEDPKFGFWTYTLEQRKIFKQQQQEIMDLRKKEEERIKEERMLMARKRAEKHAKLKEKQLKRKDPLGLKRINEIIRELRIAHNKYVIKERKKQYKFKVDEDYNINIVEKQKIKKLSKIQKAKQLYLENKDPDYETVTEDEFPKQIQENQKLKLLIQQMSQLNPITGQLYNQMKIRCWVQMIPIKEIDDLILLFINSLSLSQAKKKVVEPKKFKKRILAGFRECQRTLQTTLIEKQSKMIIIPINILECPLENGTDHQVLQILNLAQQRDVPIIHSSNRSKLGRAFCGKFGPKISVISVINYQNAEDKFNELIELKIKQEQEYKKKYGNIDLKQIYKQL